MDKRYQVFVSSTYADLREERQRVIQTLMEMDCIPAGMEEHPADSRVQHHLAQLLHDRRHEPRSESYRDIEISVEDFQTVKIQFLARGFIRVEYQRTMAGPAALFWSLTPIGNNAMLQLRSVKHSSE